ncbi:hypothetical protein DM49_3341 [Burkholderia mallei]|nr:hypothetical protein DM49_3341 [Burkholderia mallei]
MLCLRICGRGNERECRQAQGRSLHAGLRRHSVRLGGARIIKGKGARVRRAPRLLTNPTFCERGVLSFWDQDCGFAASG